VRRRDGSLSSLRELTTLQRWIVEGKLGREDEVGLDGENWRVLGTIPDLGAFFAAADAQARVVALEEELARLKLLAPASAVGTDLAGAVSEALATPEAAAALEAPRPRAPARTLTSAGPTSPPTLREPAPPIRPAPATEGAKEPAFTRTAAGLGVAPADDWEPPKLRRGVGAWAVVVLLLVSLASAGVWAYFYLWLPERQRAHEEQSRSNQLEQAQTEHEVQVRAAEQRAKQELLQSLAAGEVRDAGAPAAPDAGLLPRGSREAPPTGTPPLAAPAEARVPTPTLVAAPSPPASAKRPAGDPSGEGDSPAVATAAPPAARGAPLTFEEWMAEADRRRTHERASSALAAYDRALALKPLRSDAHAGRGLALLDLGRRQEALAQFQRALELDPRDGVAVLGLAETYRSLGRSEEARRAYQRYLDGWPAGAEARAARAALESLKE
jgi:tetratricopeptide (TPR) repeat protein